MLPSAWKPIQSHGTTRVGGANDGGYTVSEAAIAASGTLISMGLDTNWDFEEEFLEITGGDVVCFDHTVTPRSWVKYTARMIVKRQVSDATKSLRYRRFFSRSDAEHRRLKIGYDGAGAVSLKTILTDYPRRTDLMLKVDIEGSEYRILDQIVEHRAQFTAVVLEFHDVDLHRDRIDRFFAQMTGFRNIWLHANNFGGVDAAMDPLVFEVSLARDELCGPKLQHGHRRLATAPNNPSSPDIVVRYDD